MLALALVFAAVELLEDEEDDASAITGVVAAVVVMVSVEAVWEDLVLLLQPLRANPARIKVNSVEFFIGGLSCASTDPALLDRFASPAATAAREPRRAIPRKTPTPAVDPGVAPKCVSIVLARNAAPARGVFRGTLPPVLGGLSYADSRRQNWRIFPREKGAGGEGPAGGGKQAARPSSEEARRLRRSDMGEKNKSPVARDCVPPATGPSAHGRRGLVVTR